MQIGELCDFLLPTGMIAAWGEGYTITNSCADPEGEQGVQIPLENHKAKGFL